MIMLVPAGVRSCTFFGCGWCLAEQRCGPDSQGSCEIGPENHVGAVGSGSCPGHQPAAQTGAPAAVPAAGAGRPSANKFKPAGDMAWDAPPTAMELLTYELDEDGRQTGSLPQVLADREAVLVFFHAPWCNYCKSVKPVVEQAAMALQSEGRAGAVVQVEMNVPAGHHSLRTLQLQLPAARLYVNRACKHRPLLPPPSGCCHFDDPPVCSCSSWPGNAYRLLGLRRDGGA